MDCVFLNELLWKFVIKTCQHGISLDLVSSKVLRPLVSLLNHRLIIIKILQELRRAFMENKNLCVLQKDMGRR